MQLFCSSMNRVSSLATTRELVLSFQYSSACTALAAAAVVDAGSAKPGMLTGPSLPV